MRITSLTHPGRRRDRNEDWYGSGANVAVLLDGVTAPGDMGTGCRHNVPWYVSRLGERIIKYAEAQHSLQESLYQAIDDIAVLHSKTCDLSNTGTPSATVVIFRAGAESCDWLVLSDSTLVLEVAGDIVVVADKSVTPVAMRQQETSESHPIGSDQHREAVHDMIEEQRRWRNQPGGYFLASADPEAANYAMTGSAPRADVDCAVMLSDGASCLVDAYAYTDWRGLLDGVKDLGPDWVINAVRAIENQDSVGSEYSRFKSSDDATVMVVTELHDNTQPENSCHPDS